MWLKPNPSKYFKQQFMKMPGAFKIGRIFFSSTIVSYLDQENIELFVSGAVILTGSEFVGLIKIGLLVVCFEFLIKSIEEVGFSFCWRNSQVAKKSWHVSSPATDWCQPSLRRNILQLSSIWQKMTTLRAVNFLKKNKAL